MKLYPKINKAQIFLLFLAISCSRESAESLYQNGEDLWSKGEVERSLNNFLTIINNYPESDQYDNALFKAGELYYLNYNDYSKAIKYFRQLAASKESITKIKFQAQTYIAEIYENSLHNYDLAIIEYQRLINNFDKWMQPGFGHYKIAECYYKKGDYNQAIIEYETLLEQFPSSSLVQESINQIVTCYYILGDCSKAFEKYDVFKEKYSASQLMPEIRFEIGSCYEEEGNLTKSLRIFEDLKGAYSNKKLLEMKIKSIEKRLSVRKR